MIVGDRVKIIASDWDDEKGVIVSFSQYYVKVKLDNVDTYDDLAYPNEGIGLFQMKELEVIG